MDFKQKYIKYKEKYLKLKILIGGSLWLEQRHKSGEEIAKITNDAITKSIVEEKLFGKEAA
jgi:hypothetical protein